MTALVIEDGGTEDEAIGALLHDSIEDQGDKYPGGRPALRHYIEHRFGRKVLDIVNTNTDDDAFPKEQWRARKEAFVQRIKTASGSARRVIRADKLHNAQSILTDLLDTPNQSTVWARFREKRPSEQLWYYATLAKEFANEGRLGRELVRIVKMIRIV